VSLARSVLDAALSTLPLLDENARAPALAALDGFIARPAPSTHLAALRVLRELRIGVRRSHSRAALVARARDRGLERLSQWAPGLASDLAAVDPASGQRLDALATLLEAHGELVARVRRAERARQPFIERIRDQAQPQPDRRTPKRRSR
jgi:hypothetical protein